MIIWGAGRWGGEGDIISVLMTLYLKVSVDPGSFLELFVFGSVIMQRHFCHGNLNVLNSGLFSKFLKALLPFYHDD